MSIWRAALAAASRAARTSTTAQRAAAGACAAAAIGASSASRLGFAAASQHRIYAAALCAAAAATVAFPPSTAHASAAVSATPPPRSFIMIKPDGVHRGLISEIVSRFEKKGYKLVGIKVVVPTTTLAEEHYAEHKGKPFFPKLVDFLSSGPVVAMVWEGTNVVKVGRAMIGATNPSASAPGTIRGDFGIETGRNIIHGSDSDESAQREIALWFKDGEIAEYKAHSETWVYE